MQLTGRALVRALSSIGVIEIWLPVRPICLTNQSTYPLVWSLRTHTLVHSIRETIGERKCVRTERPPPKQRVSHSGLHWNRIEWTPPFWLSTHIHPSTDRPKQMADILWKQFDCILRSKVSFKLKVTVNLSLVISKTCLASWNSVSSSQLGLTLASPLQCWLWRLTNTIIRAVVTGWLLPRIPSPFLKHVSHGLSTWGWHWPRSKLSSAFGFEFGSISDWSRPETTCNCPVKPREIDHAKLLIWVITPYESSQPICYTLIPAINDW